MVPLAILGCEEMLAVVVEVAMPGEEDQDRIARLGEHQPLLELALKVHLERTEMCLRLVVGDQEIRWGS